MFDVLVQMAALIACGVLWRATRPGGIDVETLRLSLTTLVYYLLLPALVLLVLWQTQLGVASLKISAAVGVLFCLLLAWLCYHRLQNRAFIGAAILAAAFPNATYLVCRYWRQPLAPGHAASRSSSTCLPVRRCC